MSYIESLLPEDKERYLTKLTKNGLDCCPYVKKDWVEDPTQWPPVAYVDIYNYLIDSPGIYSKGTMKNWRSLDAVNFFESGYVGVVLHKTIPGTENVLMRCDVKPSWRTTGKPHRTWLAVQGDGSVLTVHCDCKAGLGESCSHAAAVLFKLEAWIRLKINEVPCTSRACEWNRVCVKKIEPALIAETTFYKPKPSSKRKAPVPKASASQQQAFLNILAEKAPDAVGLKGFRDFSKPAKKPWFFSQHEVTPAEIEEVERETLTQASCERWHDERVGRITASIAHRVLKCSNPSKNFINEICQRNRPLNKPWITWGKEQEKGAIATYRYAVGGPLTDTILSSFIHITDEVKKTHENLVISEAGLRICQHMPFMGASCDGYVSCDCCGEGVLEVKCPYKWAMTPVAYQQWPEQKGGHLENHTSLKRNHSYYTQVQMQLFVTQRAYADFITWTPQDCLIFRVPRDEEFISNAVSHIQTFWLKHISPRLQELKDAQHTWSDLSGGTGVTSQARDGGTASCSGHGDGRPKTKKNRDKVQTRCAVL